jgi:hypothetical protein
VAGNSCGEGIAGVYYGSDAHLATDGRFATDLRDRIQDSIPFAGQLEWAADNQSSTWSGYAQSIKWRNQSIAADRYWETG